MITRLQDEVPGLTLRVVDVTEHPELAVRYRVMATPAVAINGRLVCAGVPRAEDLRRRILEAARVLSP